jgi:hypothetical protein
VKLFLVTAPPDGDGYREDHLVVAPDHKTAVSAFQLHLDGRPDEHKAVSEPDYRSPLWIARQLPEIAGRPARFTGRAPDVIGWDHSDIRFFLPLED